MDGISRSRGWDKEIPHGVLPMEQLVLSDKWARIFNLVLVLLDSQNQEWDKVVFNYILLGEHPGC